MSRKSLLADSEQNTGGGIIGLIREQRCTGTAGLRLIVED